MIYWAPGGGLGHLTRAAAVIHTLNISAPVTIYGSRSHWPAWLSLPENASYQSIGDKPAELARSLAGTTTELWMDTFPAGLHGEWKELETPYTLIARRLRWDRYVDRVGDAGLRPKRVLQLEDLESAEAQWIGDAPTSHLELADPPATPGTLELSDKPNWLIMHSGPASEVEHLVEHARLTARLAKAAPKVWLASEISLIANDITPLRERPVWPLLSRFNKVVSAAGFNSVRQVLAAGVDHEFVPLERSLDDQYFRASRAGSPTQ